MVICQWRVPDYGIPKYATLAWGMFWAKGNWEPADTQGKLFASS